ncbi:MAG: adenine deaminase C-terminal domain-containing protein [Carboxydocellales bacterium]
MKIQQIEQLKSLIRVARGFESADTYISGARVLNVYTGEVIQANLAIKDGLIAYVGQEEKPVSSQTKLIDASNFFLVPGYIEPHAHSLIFNLLTFGEALLCRGVTTMVMDTLFLNFYRQGIGQLGQVASTLKSLPMTVLWGLRVDSPTPHPAEEELFPQREIENALSADCVHSICELTSWRKILQGNEKILKYLTIARAHGKNIDLHTAGARGSDLQALVASGATDCHESINVREALERLRIGEYLLLRNSAIRRDLPELLKIITEQQMPTSRLMFTTDGPTPSYLMKEGSIDGMIAMALTHGIQPITAYQMATLNPATYLRIDHLLGGIAPGRKADINFLTSLEEPTPVMVMQDGHLVAAQNKLLQPFSKFDWSNFRWKPKKEALSPVIFVADTERDTYPVIKLETEVLTRRVDMPGLGKELPQGLLNLTLLDVEDRWVINGFIQNLADNSLEAIASSNTMTGKCGIIVVGNNHDSMAQAANMVLDMKGGIVLLENGKPSCTIPLTIGGVMSEDSMETLARHQDILTSRLKQRGYKFNEIFYSLLFLMSSFLPDIRICPAGIYDVRNNQVLIKPVYY